LSRDVSVDPYVTRDTPCVRLPGVLRLEAATSGLSRTRHLCARPPAFPVRPRWAAGVRGPRFQLPLTVVNVRRLQPTSERPTARSARCVPLGLDALVASRVATGFWPLAWRLRSRAPCTPIGGAWWPGRPTTAAIGHRLAPIGPRRRSGTRWDGWPSRQDRLRRWSASCWYRARRTRKVGLHATFPRVGFQLL
jgi:hypothetical protein